MNNTQRLQHNLDAAREVMEKERAYFEEISTEYSAVAGTADDDELEFREESIAQYTAVVKRSEARVVALVKQLADSEANDRQAEGEAAQAEADSLLAELQSLLGEAAPCVAKLSEISAKGKPLLEKINEKRRWVKHCGVQLTPPTLKAPDIGPALEAVHTIARLPGAVWTNLYG